MNQLTVPVLTMSSRDSIKAHVLTPEIQELDALTFEGIYLDAQIEPLNSMGIVNSTTPNLNPMGMPKTGYTFEFLEGYNMNQYVLASYRTNTESDIEADLIVNKEPCSFIELIAIDDGIQGITDTMNQLMQNPKAKDVLVLHGGSLSRLFDAFMGGIEA